MARQRRGDKEEAPELNLAPIMNMVVILIPLLLLSVVFLQVGVINITAPKLSVGPPSDTPPPEEKALNLTVAVGDKGFNIAATDANVPERPGCPVPGPTICLEKRDVDVSQKFQRARELLTSGELSAGEAEMEEAMAAYNWVELYNQLVKIKSEYKEETVIKIAADPDVPYAAIVRVMDLARFRLAKDTYSKPSEMWTAEYRKTGVEFDTLFPDPVLAIAQ